MDKLRMQILRSRLAKISLQELFEGEEFSTLQHWQRQGFSPKMIQGFLAPFFRGIFLTEPENVSRRMFDFVFSMFGQGRALLPAGGMQAIPESLAEGLAETELRLKTPVERVEAKRVWTTSGEEISASAVVVTAPELKPFNLNTAEYLTPPHSVSCLYFDAPIAPVNGPWFILNGSGRGQITQVSVNSSVAEGYAPQGRHLISVSVNGSSTNKESERVQNVRTELIDWFGSQVDLWRFLKMMQVDYALPSFEPGQLPGPKWKQEKGIYLCGDGFNHPSLQGAMESGAAVASELIEQGV
jgi:protoporphyrinogen oxidase